MLNLIVCHLDNYVDDHELILHLLLEAINHEQLYQNDHYYGIEILCLELLVEVIHKMLVSYVLIYQDIKEFI